MTDKKRGLLFYAVLATVLLLCIWLASRIPYAHDDWGWGIDAGIRAWLSGTLNSRYVGNFFVILMTRSTRAKTLIMGTSFFLIPFLIAKNSQATERSRLHRTLLFLFATAFTFAMPLSMWRQTYGWVAGFANFGLSALFLLVYFTIVFSDRRRHTRLKCIALIPLVIATQLFIENVTVYLCLFSAAMLLYTKLRYKKFEGMFLISLAASIAGVLIIYLCSDIYTTLAEEGIALDGVRALSFERDAGLLAAVNGIFLHYATELDHLVLQRNWHYVGIISGLCIWLMLRSGKKWRVRPLLAVTMLAYSTYCLMLRMDTSGWALFQDTVWNGIANTAATYLFLAAVIACICLYVERGALRDKLLFFLISAPLVIFPYAILFDVGPRFFYTSNIFLALFACTLLSQLMGNTEETVLRACGAVGAVFVVLFGYYGRAYYVIGNTDRTRNAIIEQAVAEGADTIVLPSDRYTDFSWWRTPEHVDRIKEYKEFYGIPQEVTLINDGI